MAQNNTRRLTAVLFVGTLALASTAGATLARAIPFDEKVDKAEAIVLVKCIRTKAQWDSEHRFILTYTTFSVEKSLKGQPPQEITLVTPGGTVGPLRQSTIGIPSFREGDERIVFVRNTPAGPTVLDFDQGTYEVRSESNGEKTIVPVATGAVQVDSQRGLAVPAEARRTLREFERDVNESARRKQAEQMVMVRTRHQGQRPSIAVTLLRYRFLIALALVGAALASWQLLRR